MSDLAYSDAKYLLDTKPTWSVDQPSRAGWVYQPALIAVRDT